MEIDFDGVDDPDEYSIEISVEAIPGDNLDDHMASFEAWCNAITRFAKLHQGECLNVFDGGKYTDDAMGSTAQFF